MATLAERQHGVVSRSQLRDLGVPEAMRAMQVSRRRGAPSLRAVLSDWQGAAGTSDRSWRRLRSELEARLLALIGRADLPSPYCNRRIAANGGSFEVDFLWPEQRLVVETDGGHFHDNPVAFERDRMRDRALQLAGFRVVRFTYAQIENEPEAVISATRRLLAAGFG